MRTLTKREVDDICYKHELYLNHDPRGERADFSDCDLSNLSLINKRLDGAIFENANLSGCNMDKTDITGCNFAFADLTGVYLHDSNAAECNFKNAILSEAKLDSVVLFMSDLSGANLTNSDMYSVIATGANFDRAVLDNSHMTAFNGDRAIFEGASIRNCDCSLANFHFATFKNANISRSNMFKASMLFANLTETNVVGTDFFQADLSSADLLGTDMSKAFNVDVANMRDIRNFDVSEYKTAVEQGTITTPTTQQARQMPTFTSYIQAEVEKQIDRGQWINPIAQETYFAGRDNPLLATANPLMGGEAVKPTIVDVSQNRDKLERKDSYLGSNTEKPKLMFSRELMQKEQSNKQQITQNEPGKSKDSFSL